MRYTPQKNIPGASYEYTRVLFRLEFHFRGISRDFKGPEGSVSELLAG